MTQELEIAYRLQRSGDGYLVFADGDRLGWVRKVGKVWAATDRFMKATGNSHKTRAAAVARLRRQVAKAQLTALDEWLGKGGNAPG